MVAFAEKYLWGHNLRTLFMANQECLFKGLALFI